MLIAGDCQIPDAELMESFIRSPGPGGQNVNKVATAVELRFDIARSSAFSDAQRQRLLSRRDRRLTDAGVMVIQARRFRSQDRNRDDARQRLADWIVRALAVDKPRLATKPSRASQQRRIDAKKQRGQVKSTRRVRDWD